MLKRLTVIFFVVYFEVFCNNIDPHLESCDRRYPERDIAFSSMGTYRGFLNDGTEYKKSFFVPNRLKGNWVQSKRYCRTFGLELTTLETSLEAKTFLALVESFTSFLPTPQSFYIDGFAQTGGSIDDWYWTRNGNKISFSIPWAPNEPNFADEQEFCMSIGKARDDLDWGFNDVNCQNKTDVFICQRIDFNVPIRVN